MGIFAFGVYAKICKNSHYFQRHSWSSTKNTKKTLGSVNLLICKMFI